MITETNKGARVTTAGLVRLQFGRNMFEKSNLSDKYEATVLVPKTDTATMEEIKEAIEQAKSKGKDSWGGKAPANCPTPVYDGDGIRPNGDPFSEEAHGCYVFTARSNELPVVVDDKGNPLGESDVYSGCYGKLAFSSYAYNYQGKKGIGFGLDGFQMLEDGEPLAGAKPTAESLFGVKTPAADMFGL